MGILNKLRRKKGPRLAVIALDGVPYTFMEREMARGNLPNLKRLAEEGNFRQMNSVHPCVSSVAWTSYSTGAQAGEHNIYGFVDRKPETGELFIPTGKNNPCKLLYEELSEAGHRVAVINVPVTYPPRRVNGLLVSGFLASDLSKATYPTELGRRLQKMGYIIDVDPMKGRAEDKQPFLDELHLAVEKRFQFYNELIEEGGYDYLHVHIMETDRINHFLWDQYAGEDPEYGEKYLDVYRHIDREVGKTVELLPDDTPLLLLSDHGFCGIIKEVFLNHYLIEKGWLEIAKPDAMDLTALGPSTKAYSLIPGRIFVNLAGREKNGSVPPEEFDAVREALTRDLLELADPDSGNPIIAEVLRKEDLYHGRSYDRSPDLVAVPHDGYDLKGQLNPKALTARGPLNGMHTFHDAFLITRDFVIDAEQKPAIPDLKEYVFRHFGMN